MHIYRGKYPNRIFSVWKMSDKFAQLNNLTPFYIAQTNDGRMFRISLRSGSLSSLHSSSDIVALKIDIPKDRTAHDQLVTTDRGYAVLEFRFWQQSEIRKAK